MNDPRLEKPIQASADEIEQTLKKRLKPQPPGKKDAEGENASRGAFQKKLKTGQDEQKQKRDEYSQPKRWWFTSTAFPLVAGTFGPLANLMSVCALVQSWRVNVPPGRDEEDAAQRVDDPKWLLAINTVSLVFAIAANMLLLLNFAQRVRYAIAQPLTIIFWYISSFLLVSLVIVAHYRLRLPKESHAFSQSYFYGVISATLYFVVSTMLLWNYLGAYVFKAYSPSFTSLTIPQRTLMLQTISYVFYLSLGGGTFSWLEGWSFVDGVYWADYTLLTIGLGSDFQLKRNVSRGLFVPYAAIGIIMVGLVIGSVRGLFLERGKIKLRLRALEKKRQKVMEGLNSTDCDWRQEFDLMRDVQDAADKRRRYWRLGSSLIAFLIVWLGGAMAFTFAEKSQGWTYFQALYFTYTSLLTIGYGDYYPRSNFGKPFFVLWSLIAIPSVTILISNMGDTVVGWVKEGTLWLGQKTILPERDSKFPFLESPSKVEKEVGMENAREEAEEAEEAEKAEEAIESKKIIEEKGGKGKHELARKIAGEISKLAKDIGSNPARKYEWAEWKRFLALLGEGEDDANDGVDVEWKWLGREGPLLSGVTETEWILKKMCQRLENIMVGEKNV